MSYLKLNATSKYTKLRFAETTAFETIKLCLNNKWITPQSLQ